MSRRALVCFAALSVLAASGCATAPVSPVVIPAAPRVAPEKPAPTPLAMMAVPEITTCAEESPQGQSPEPSEPSGSGPGPGAATEVDPPAAAEAPEESRCAREVMVSTAMSYLGKTAAEFDEVTATVVLREYDPDELLDEALADPRFRQLVAMSDAKPRDGRLSAAEAIGVETAVLAHLEAAQSED